MAITPSDFNLSISPNPIQVVVGMTSNVNLSFSNTSLTERGYNLTATLTLPDGVSYAGGAIPPTSTVNGPGGTIILTWTNIKDLAPNEINYILGVTLKADETFRTSGLPVTFDTPLSSVTLQGTVDTLPRGNDDPGNVKITKNDSASFIPLRYMLTKIAPGKMPKGAGLLSPVTSPLWTYQYTLIVQNNSREPSTVTLIDNLPNGVRFLGINSVSGPDSIALSSPTVINPSGGIGGQNFTTLNWGTVVLSPISVNTIIFNAAIWNNYTVNGIENSGAKIPHLAPLQNVATLNGSSGPVQGISVTNAMDLTINKSVTPSSTDVNQINNYTLTYRVNQYDNVGNVVITDTLSDGQTYNVGSASVIPVNPNPPRNPDGTTTLTWNLGSLAKGITSNITFTTTTSLNYFLGGPVSAGDTLSNNVAISGTNETTITPTPDNSSSTQGIGLPSINKEIINYFYKDGTPKTSSIVAPGDKVEFKITYSSIGINSPQLGIEIDEYAPPNMGPVTPALPITYGGTLGNSFPLVTVSPNGLRWTLGTVPGNSLWTADFLLPVANVNFVGTSNNLAKLAGINTVGLGYSSRDQVEVEFGQPNVTFNKSVTGPDINAIKAGEIYTYSVTISNPQNLDGNVTDAFEMDLTDVIPTGLTYAGTFSVIGTGTYTTPSFVGQNISMTILKLAPGNTLTLNYNVLVTPSVVSGKSYINNAILQRPYSQPDRSYQFPGAPFTSSTTLKALGITMTKLVSPILAKIGDVVTYILQVTVPLGTTAYNVQVIDNFPSTNQSFISGSATKDNLPITPSVVGGTVTFPVVPFVNATVAPVNILYSFNVRVVNGTHVSPFIENQTNNATVNWNLDNIGTPATPFNTSAILQVRTPNLTGRKEQRNVTNPGIFTSTNLNYNVGDVIQYRITMTNTGAESAFNSVVTDVINPLLSFNSGTIVATNGTASVTGNLLTWIIPVIPSGASATLTFNVTTLPGIGADGRIPNNATFLYNTNDNGFGINYGPINTNTVQLVARPVTISKTSSISQGEIGDDITYTITFTVPNGTIAYTPILTDALPPGQSYIGLATRQDGLGPIVTVLPTVIGQNITFPTDPNIDASAGTRTIIYTFVARITSATHVTPFTETQTDRANINWGRTSSGPRINSAATASVLARTPNITILKEQRNVTTGGSYTTSNISALPGDVIYYRLTINSNGASPAFNINLTDLLSSKITFVGDIFGPTVGSITPPGASLLWHIDQLDSGSSAVYEFQISINNGIGAGDSIPNTTSAIYDSNDVNPISYNQNSNTVIIDIPLISFSKIANTTSATIGSTIDYTLIVTIPNGVSVNNLSFTDTIPPGQNYVVSSFSGTPPPLGTLTATPNQLIYEDSELSRTGPLILTYTFSTTVISGNVVFPYTQVQRNVADVHWNITPLGPTGAVSDFEDVTIRTPHISALKEQRLLPLGEFTTTPLLGITTSDIVEYRITLTNDGASDAYNVVTSDILDSSLTFSSVTSASSGTVTPPPPGPGGTVNWTINPGPIAVGSSEILIFKVDVNNGPSPGTAVFDQTSTIYDTLDTNPTTLGPSLSNQVAFNYNLPVIDKSVDKNAVFVGDVVSYTVAVTIPQGNIAYNLRLTDTLPPEQSYNAGSLKVDNIPTAPASINPLVSPLIASVDATSSAVTILYTFDATINSISMAPQQLQVNNATLTWTLDADGNFPGGPVTDNIPVYVTNSNIDITKTQSNNIGGPFASSQIQTTVGSLIYYKLSVTNPGPNQIFDVIVTDNLDPLLQLVSFDHNVGTSLISGNTLTWTISSIETSITYDAIVTALVLPGGSVNGKISNLFTATFDAVNPPPEIEYGPIISNTVDATLPSLIFNKSVSKSNVELGEIVTYTLSVTIPNGITAYNVVVSDILPANQNYVGNALIDGISVEASQVGQVITFPTQTTVTANSGERVLKFKFDARVVVGNNLPPYTEIQTNNATLNYSINPQGTPATPLNSNSDITVSNPALSVIKTQRNVTQEGGFRIIPISVDVGDIVRYKLEAISSGASPAYNVVITDILGAFDQFVGIIFASGGSAVYDSNTDTVIWTIDTIPVGTIYELLFDVQILPSVGSGGSTKNFASYIYGSTPVTPINLGPTKTNEVVTLYPTIKIEKSSNTDTAIIGQVITYTTSFTVPKGTLAYNIQLSDILPVGEQYNGNATLNGLPIVADSVNGQLINFSSVPFLDATTGEIIYIYTFEAIVTSANVNPTTLIDININQSSVNWNIDPKKPAEPMAATTSVYVTNSSIVLNKLQRNVSQEDSFTADDITGFVGQIIEYSLTVTNPGPNIVYNVILTDLLSNNLSFIAPITVPFGTLSHSGEDTNGIVTWSLSPLNVGESITAVFSVEIKTQPSAPINNLALGDFGVSPAPPFTFQSPDSNDTNLIPSQPIIQISSNSIVTVFSKCKCPESCNDKLCKDK